MPTPTGPVDFGEVFAVVDEAFADLPALEGQVNGCGQCYTDEELRMLGGDPAALPDKLVVSFAHETLGHFEADQYRILWQRLAPRILRLIAAGEVILDGHGLFGLASEEVGFGGWDRRRQDAVRLALAATLVGSVRTGKDLFSLRELVDGLARLDRDIRPWLDRLAQYPDLTTRIGVTGLALRWALESMWADGPAFDEESTKETVRSWLCGTGVAECVATVRSALPSCRTAHDAELALLALSEGDAGPWIQPAYGYYRAEGSSLKDFNPQLRLLR